MRRLLKGRTWRIRGNNAVEASMVVAVAAIALPLLLFAGASWIAYDETRQQADERMVRTLDLPYTSVRTTFESEYLVAANVTEMLEDRRQRAQSVRALWSDRSADLPSRPRRQS